MRYIVKATGEALKSGVYDMQKQAFIMKFISYQDAKECADSMNDPNAIDLGKVFFYKGIAYEITSIGYDSVRAHNYVEGKMLDLRMQDFKEIWDNQDKHKDALQREVFKE